MPHHPIILFDVMETLVNEPFFETLPRFFGLTMQELLETKHPTSWIEFEKGKITEDEYLASFFKDGRPVDRDALRQCLHESFEWLEGMKDLVQELHAAGFEMHALSNYSTWYELIEEKLEPSRYLHWTFVSCMTGLRKPDPDAYLGAARCLQVATEDCLFIDDRAVNIEAAKSVGMDAILRHDLAELRDELRQRGML